MYEYLLEHLKVRTNTERDISMTNKKFLEL